MSERRSSFHRIRQRFSAEGPCRFEIEPRFAAGTIRKSATSPALRVLRVSRSSESGSPVPACSAARIAARVCPCANGVETRRARKRAIYSTRCTETGSTYVVGMRALILAISVVSTGCLMHRAERLPENIPPVSGKAHVAFAEREIDITQGTGALAEPRKCFYVHYTGWLTNGKQFDSSHDTTAQGAPRASTHVSVSVTAALVA